jgi:peptidyl-prolyl cis-trans isomerase C
MTRFQNIKVGAAVVLLLGWTQASQADIAKVNSKTLTEADLKAAVSGINEVQADTLLKDKTSRRQLVNSLIEQELLLQKAESDKLDQSADYKRAVENFRKQFLVSAILEKNLKTKLTDKAARDYYGKNKLKFSTDQVRAQHILVATEKEAQEMLKKAKEKDADFQALAEKSSKDPSAKNNRGDLGYFTRDRMVAEFAEAAFNGKPGQIVGPVKTTFGYHIIKVVDIKPGKVPGFEEVEMQVKNNLRQSLIEDYVGTLRKSAKIQVLDPAIN